MVTTRLLTGILLWCCVVEDVKGGFYISRVDWGETRFFAKILGSYDEITNKQFDWSNEESKRAARVARNYEHVRAILCKTTTWNYNVYRFDDNWCIQLYSFNSLYFISRRTHQSSYSVLCQNYTTRTRWDNHKQTQLGRCLFPSDFFLAVAVVIAKAPY